MSLAVQMHLFASATRCPCCQPHQWACTSHGKSFLVHLDLTGPPVGPEFGPASEGLDSVTMNVLSTPM